MPSHSSGVDLIAAERQRQVEREGWTPEHDDGHADGALARAAACYADGFEITGKFSVPLRWPFEASDWKPSDDRVRDLVKAGALIAAEIDRIERSR